MTAFQEQLQHLPAYLGGHLRLTLIALTVGTAVSIPLGIFASQYARLERLILGVAGVIQTIPGLALLAVMVPLLNMIGIVPALIALTLYSLLPILRNTVVGIGEIDENIIEAGRGIGMTRGQLLRIVQLPLALPVIIAGLRTSTVWVVGIATLSTPVGATSLGNYIFSGLQTRNNMAILFGCVAAAVLALTLDGIIHGFETGLRENRRKRIIASAVAALAVLLLTVFLGVTRQEDRTVRTQTVAIGGKPFTEQYILMDFLSRVVNPQPGYRAARTMDAVLMYSAIREGNVDVISAYTTDGRIAAYNLKILEDPAGVFPPYHALLLLSPEASRDSTLVNLAAQLEGTIDADLMRRMNMLVDQEGQSPETAGRELYERVLGGGDEGAVTEQYSDGVLRLPDMGRLVERCGS